MREEMLNRQNFGPKMQFHFLFLTLFGDCSVTSGGGLHKAEASCRRVGRLYRGLAAPVLWAGRRPRGKNGDEMAGSER